jgi:two-component system sensor histidine kinase/response regulator
METSREEMRQEIDMLRREIKVSREAAEITSQFVVKQFEKTQRMMQRFQTAQSELQAVLDGATQLSIISTDLDGTIRLFSRGASTLLGYKATDMTDKINILSLHLPDELAHYGRIVGGISGKIFQGMQVFDQLVKQKINYGQEWVYVCRDTRHLPVSLAVTSLFDPRGGIVGYLFTAMDLTPQKQLTRELILAKEAAEAANASRGSFLARMSHEIRTPMNGIIGMGMLLEKTQLEPRQRNYTKKLMSSAKTLLGLINDILDFSKIDAGKLVLEKVKFRLEDILGNVTNVVGMQAEEKGLEFLFRVDRAVPAELVGDPLRLGQVLLNLASNGVKFTEKGEIVITVQQESIHDNETVLRFTVQDSGIGLHADQARSLFSPFSQADDSITRKYGGTGLGLAICKQLTELMHGRIWVDSEPGKGARFIFTSRFRLPDTIVTFPDSSGQQFQGLRALVVDDNEMARDVLSSMLSSLRVSVDTAVDGTSAISRLEEAAAREEPYDFVLLDWIMPGIDGIETARRIKSNSSLARVPALLMVTANGREEVFLEAEQAGLDAFLVKPVYASVLYNTLQDILGLTAVAARVRTQKSGPLINLDRILGAHVLVADDNAVNQEVASEFLTDAGLQVSVCSSGRECIELLQKNRFDLVLMDIQMPEMDGLEATRRIRKTLRFSSLPIIAMTAHAMEGDREKSLEAGMNDHITKPIDPLLLYQALLQWIAPGDENAGDGSGSFTGPFSGTDTSLLPPLPGIDREAALQALNYKSKLFIKMLYDFRKNFGNLGEDLKKLAARNLWDEIRERAHTVKGVAGYIGATGLGEAAEQLENRLKKDSKSRPQDLLHVFIECLASISAALSILPDPVTDSAQSRSSTTADMDYRLWEKSLQLLRDQLLRGEVAAEETFVAVRQMLSKNVVPDQLERLAELIEDIEYELAAELVDKILRQIARR